MKTFPVPTPIVIVDPMNGQPVMEAPPGGPPVPAIWTFKRWFVVLLNDPRARGETVEATGRLYSVLLPAVSVESGAVSLEDADYARLLPLVKAPPVVYQGPLMDAQLAPFSVAFQSAKDGAP